MYTGYDRFITIRLLWLMWCFKPFQLFACFMCCSPDEDAQACSYSVTVTPYSKQGRQHEKQRASRVYEEQYCTVYLNVAHVGGDDIKPVLRNQPPEQNHTTVVRRDLPRASKRDRHAKQRKAGKSIAWKNKRTPLTVKSVWTGRGGWRRGWGRWFWKPLPRQRSLTFAPLQHQPRQIHQAPARQAPFHKKRRRWRYKLLFLLLSLRRDVNIYVRWSLLRDPG